MNPNEAKLKNRYKSKVLDFSRNMSCGKKEAFLTVL